MDRWVPGGWTPIKKKNMAGIASYAFNATEGLDLARYKGFWFELDGLLVTTDDTSIFVRTSGNSGASDYIQAGQNWRSNDTTAVTSPTAGSSFRLCEGSDANWRIGSVGANELGMSGAVRLVQGGSALAPPHIQWRVSFRNASGNLVYSCGSGFRDNTTPITSVDFLSSDGVAFEKGEISIYGYKRIA